ncbi:MAG: Asp-tRNA(Asn)/Glu-tRNA(Gln) amidotransferase subunit GatB [Deltaproteobacteria bacterium]|nr:Asp-tRNA(Asn)/Glu-tRNA(Gln) amidotransferase subunit GatB [Deltaproteobacteria bacterium]
MDFEAVIGLEVHAQLLTRSKLFCGCSTDVHSRTNANVCPVCAAHPGTLPVLNRKAVEFAVKAALATNCRINSRSIFARKNYFYPDLPKGYQISQYDQPLAVGGYIDIEAAASKRVRLTRIHMEEDAGKSVHAQGYSMVNLNRAGTPLIEIVSEPDIRSAEEAGAYLRKLRAILMYIDVCDGNMQEGSFRCDANVSVRPRGSGKFGTRAEIKNVNSFRFVEKAIEYEIRRQIQIVESGGTVVQETRTYDSGKNVTVSMRSKEEAHDYRYFPEPDLIALKIPEAMITVAQATLAELPDQKKNRYEQMGIPAYDANVITSSKKLAEFFDEACGTGEVHGEGLNSTFVSPKDVSNWVIGELLRLLKADEREIDDFKMNPYHLRTLVKLVREGAINNNTAKTVFEEMYKTGREPGEIVQAKGLAQVSDAGAIEAAIAEVIAANPSQHQDYKSGKDKLFGFFVGQVMKKMAGKANPAVVNGLLKKKLSQ